VVKSGSIEEVINQTELLKNQGSQVQLAMQKCTSVQDLLKQ
jgi:hypothetical protein